MNRDAGWPQPALLQLPLLAMVWYDTEVKGEKEKKGGKEDGVFLLCYGGVWC